MDFLGSFTAAIIGLYFWLCPLSSPAAEGWPVFEPRRRAQVCGSRILRGAHHLVGEYTPRNMSCVRLSLIQWSVRAEGVDADGSRRAITGKPSSGFRGRGSCGLGIAICAVFATAAGVHAGSYGHSNN